MVCVMLATPYQLSTPIHAIRDLHRRFSSLKAALTALTVREEGLVAAHSLGDIDAIRKDVGIQRAALQVLSWASLLSIDQAIPIHAWTAVGGDLVCDVAVVS